MDNNHFLGNREGVDARTSGMGTVGWYPHHQGGERGEEGLPWSLLPDPLILPTLSTDRPRLTSYPAVQSLTHLAHFDPAVSWRSIQNSQGNIVNQYQPTIHPNLTHGSQPFDPFPHYAPAPNHKSSRNSLPYPLDHISPDTHIPPIKSTTPTYPPATRNKNLRPPRSRKDRPCDHCRRLKHTCKITERGKPCTNCLKGRRECTFLEPPLPRHRPAAPVRPNRLLQSGSVQPSSSGQDFIGSTSTSPVQYPLSTAPTPLPGSQDVPSALESSVELDVSQLSPNSFLSWLLAGNTDVTAQSLTHNVI